jgi:hypothetical protein
LEIDALTKGKVHLCWLYGSAKKKRNKYAVKMGKKVEFTIAKKA